MAGEFYPQGISPMASQATPVGNPLAMLMAQGGTNAAAQANYEGNKMQYNLAREQNQMGYDLTKWQTNQANQQQWNLAQLEVDQRRANRDLQKYLADQANATTREANQMNYTLTGRSLDETRDADIRHLAAQEAQTLKMLDYLKLQTSAMQALDEKGTKEAVEAKGAVLDEMAAEKQVYDQVIKPADEYFTRQFTEAMDPGTDLETSLNRYNSLVHEPLYPVGDKKYSLKELSEGAVPLDPIMQNLVKAQIEKAEFSKKQIAAKWHKDPRKEGWAKSGVRDLYEVLKTYRPGLNINSLTEESLRQVVDSFQTEGFPGGPPLSRGQIVSQGKALELVWNSGGKSRKPGSMGTPELVSALKAIEAWERFKTSTQIEDVVPVESTSPDGALAAGTPTSTLPLTSGLQKPLGVSLFETAYNPKTGEWDRTKALDFLWSMEQASRQRILAAFHDAPMGPINDFLGPGTPKSEIILGTQASVPQFSAAPRSSAQLSPGNMFAR